MTPEEVRATGRLATQMLADTVAHVEQLHHAVATRAFAITAPASRPARVVHDRIACAAYGVIRRAGLATGTAVSDLAGATAGSGPPAGATRWSNQALAALNAAWGDELADQGSALAIPMAVRHERADVAPKRDALEAAFPDATARLAVFLHGLGETEESWRRYAARHDVGPAHTYGSLLARDFGYTPVYLRYNTGLHISENGRQLAALLEEMVAEWPAPVAEVVLVGHSMGGLVARSACHYAQKAGDSWIAALRHAFYLGSPHLGAGLERWVSGLTGVLGALDEGRPLSSILDRRSAGIKDLSAGRLLDDHWRDEGPVPRSPGADVPLLPTANHYAVSATVTTSRRNPFGRLVGDLLVQPGSARGRSRHGTHIPFPAGHTRHFPGLHHFALLNHPDVYEAMRTWIGHALRDRDHDAEVQARAG